MSELTPFSAQLERSSFSSTARKSILWNVV